MAEIRAIIFDGGGVLIDDPWPPMRKFCADALGVTEKDFQAVFRRLLPDFQTGRIEYRPFFEKIASELAVPMPDTGCLWTQAFEAAYREKPEMLRLARNLRLKGCKTALLTNTEPCIQKIFSQKIAGLFDIYVYSCIEQLAKPDPRIYELTLQRLGTTAQETLFIDDRQDFIDGAKAVNLNTILFTSYNDLISALQSFGIQM